jgi:hypothetical protein
LRFIIAAWIGYHVTFEYLLDSHFWAVVSTLLTLQSIPHDRMPFWHAVVIASDRIMGSVLGCVIGLASYTFINTVILRDYFFFLVYLTILMNVAASAYLYTASRRLQMAMVSSTLILTMSFSSEDVTTIGITYAFEIMVGVIVACGVYLLTMPIFYWSAYQQQQDTE